jgi:hypothetical protein
MSRPRELRPLQFRLITVMIAVTLLSILCGAIRWLFILVPTEVAIYVLVAMSLVIVFVRSYSVGLRLWRRRQDRRERERQLEATRLLLELDVVQEAIRTTQAERSANPNVGMGKQL